MATTLEYTSDSGVALTPSISSDWDGTAATGFVRRVMKEIDSGSTSDQETTETTIVGENLCQLQYVSEKPLRAQTISGSYVIGATQKVSATEATHFAYHMRVVKGDETLRGTLVNHVTESANALPGTYGAVSDSGSVSSVVCEDGDYLVVEIGYDVYNTSSKTFGTRAGSNDVDFTTDTILWLEAPANLVYPITAETQFIDDAINTNTPTWDDNGGTFTFTVATGSLPSGVTLNSSTGVISGTPTANGVYTSTIQVANSVGSTTSASITYTIEIFPTITLKMNDVLSTKMEMG